MNKVVETGHSKNIANFEILINYCTQLGEKYNPAKETLQIEALKAKLVEATEAINKVDLLKTTYTTIVNERAKLFKTIPQYITRIIAAFESGGNTPETIEEAKRCARKYNGLRSKKKVIEKYIEPRETVPGEKQEPRPKEKRYISVAQTSFNNKANHFNMLNILVKITATYQVNIPDLTRVAIEERTLQLKQSNESVINPTVLLSNARIDRNKIMYDKKDGLFIQATEIKKYIKALLGTIDDKYVEIKKLSFINLNR